jgi:hypothetical protein
VISVFAHHHIGHEGFGRQSAFNQPGRRRCLNDAGDIVRPRLFAGSACVFRTPRDDHAHLGWNLVQALRCILTNDVQRAAAARCARAAAGATLLRAFGLERRIGLVVLCLCLGERGLELFKGKRQLIVGDALGFAAEVRSGLS